MWCVFLRAGLLPRLDDIMATIKRLNSDCEPTHVLDALRHAPEVVAPNRRNEPRLRPSAISHRSAFRHRLEDPRVLCRYMGFSGGAAHTVGEGTPVQPRLFERLETRLWGRCQAVLTARPVGADHERMATYRFRRFDQATPVPWRWPGHDSGAIRVYHDFEPCELVRAWR